MSLSVQNLAHRYGNKQALKGISFHVEMGQFCALLGPNGAGKSTLFSLLTRLFVPQSGSINFGETDLAKYPREALAKIGVVFQQPTLDLDLTVRQNLSYFAALHGLAGKSAAAAIERSLERLDMAERANEKTRSLNGGHRRRMEIARSLIHKPQYLLLDEPTVGLDAKTRTDITDHVHALARDDGMTILWATHLVDEVLPQDHLVVLHQGSIVAEDTTAKVTKRKSLAKTFADLTKEPQK